VLSEIPAKKYPKGLNQLSFDRSGLKDTQRCIIRLQENGQPKAEVKVQLN